jgi:Uma2 family endonuclease
MLQLAGRVVESSGNTLSHNRVRDYLTAKLLTYADEHSLGTVVSVQPFDFSDVLCPDVSFVSSGGLLANHRNRRVLPFVPDLIVEVASEYDLLEATMERLMHYRLCGTKEVWLLVAGHAFVFSERAEFILDENDEFRSDLIPGFSICLKDLFDRA